jgi:arginine kinase
VPAGPPGSSAPDILPAFPEDCRSLLKKHLTPDVWAQLKDRKTSTGVRLYDCIRSGVANPDSEIGLYAGDAESYAVFAPLFAPVIAECHPGFRGGEAPRGDLDTAHFRAASPDPSGQYIVSTRVRVARNLSRYNLRPTATRAEDLETEQKAKEAFRALPNDLAGHYRPMAALDAHAGTVSAEDHVFTIGDRFQEAAGLRRHWPEGRGVFANEARNFFIWVNEEDQLRIISMQRNADIAAVFARLCTAMEILGRNLAFLRSDRYGYVSSCPSNLGTGLRASFLMRLPLSGGSPAFVETCLRYRLAVRGFAGERSAISRGLYDISNKRRLGLTETECLEACLEGAAALIGLEKSFEA